MGIKHSMLGAKVGAQEMRRGSGETMQPWEEQISRKHPEQLVQRPWGMHLGILGSSTEHHLMWVRRRVQNGGKGKFLLLLPQLSS